MPEIPQPRFYRLLALDFSNGITTEAAIQRVSSIKTYSCASRTQQTGAALL
jgi:hypothetical protein